MSPYSNVSTAPGTIGEALVAGFKRAIHHSHEIALNSKVNFEIPEPEKSEKRRKLRESEVGKLTTLLEEARSTLGTRLCVTQIPGYVTIAVSVSKGLKSPNYDDARRKLQEAIEGYKAKIQKGDHIL